MLLFCWIVVFFKSSGVNTPLHAQVKYAIYTSSGYNPELVGSCWSKNQHNGYLQQHSKGIFLLSLVLFTMTSTTCIMHASSLYWLPSVVVAGLWIHFWVFRIRRHSNYYVLRFSPLEIKNDKIKVLIIWRVVVSL